MMKSLTTNQFSQWLAKCGQASTENDPQASADLFSLNARYYETPFAEPIIGREAIYQYWVKGAQRLKDKTSSYQILAVKENIGIACWQANYTVIESGKHLALDCLFLVEFDDDQKCSLFREWWHLLEINTEENKQGSRIRHGSFWAK
jgi:hypothetical protein